MKTIDVNLKKNPYKIFLGYNCIKEVGTFIKKENLGNLGIIITSPKIYSLHKKLIDKTFAGKNFQIAKVPNGEAAKTKEVAFELIGKLLKADTMGKKIFLICLGGGTVGDLGGFVASIYKRGIPFIQVPTTLLAQIDASIGGKTAVDLKQAKNIVGSFYQPKAVFIDPTFLETLPKKEIKVGIAEAIKYGIIKDDKLFNFLKAKSKEIIALSPKAIIKVITTCAQIKAKIVAEDEQEKKGIRTILNFGHTIGHALEATMLFTSITHGEGVALGMIYAAELSYALNLCSQNTVIEIAQIIKKFDLPTKISFNSKTLCKALAYDKKFIAGKVRMVLVKQIGKVEVVEEISMPIIKKLLEIINHLD